MRLPTRCRRKRGHPPRWKINLRRFYSASAPPRRATGADDGHSRTAFLAGGIHGVAGFRRGRKKIARANRLWIPRTIDLLAHCAVCHGDPALEPATAAYVHHLLGLGPHAQIFDLSNACLGFVNGIAVAGAMIEGGQVQRALLVSGENGRPLVERTIARLNDGTLDRQQIKSYFANLTIGAGAVAALGTHMDGSLPHAPRLLASVVETDTSATGLCEGDTASGGGLDMQTDSEALLEAGVEVAARCWARFKTESGWDEKTPDVIICHQVGRAHQRRLFDRLWS